MAETPPAFTIADLPSEIRIPITQVVRYISVSFSFLKGTIDFFTHLLAPFLWLSPLPILGYIFAPLLVFVDITTTLFVRAPYWTVAYLLEALFPLYVFIGVACITGVLLGLIAWVMCRVLIASLRPSVESTETLKVKTEPKLGRKDPDPRRKGKKVEKFKFES